MSVEQFKQFTQELSKKITFNTENLYQHNIMIRFNDGNRKACATIINNDNMDYTKSVSRFTEYMKKFYSSDDSNATGNLKNLLQCDGYYKNGSGTWYYPKFLFYSTNDNAVRVLGLRVNTLDYAPNPNGLQVLSEFGTSFTVNDYVTTIALNNVNKPTVYQTNTNISYNGSTIGTLNWTLLKYPVNETKFRYDWIGKTTISSVSIPVTNISSNGIYESTASINIGQPSMMTNFQRNQLRTNMYSQANWGFFLYSIGSPLMNYLMRPTSATINGALDITIYGSTVE